MRIVSLLASATEIVCALGAGAELVGRSHECDNPAWVRALPPCTAPAFDVSASSGAIDAEVRRRLRTGEPLYTIDMDRINELRADLLITQSHCEVCAVTPADVSRSGVCSPGMQQLALSAACVEDIFASIGVIATALGLEAEGRRVLAGERQRLERVRERAAGFQAKSLVMLEWTDPIFAMGNWGPELVEVANGNLLIGRKGEYSAAMAAERLREADPEYLIVAPCGFSLERSLEERAVLERLAWWSELQAVRKGNVIYADGNLFFNRSGMTIAETAEIIAEVLHGCSFETQTSGVRWVRAASPRRPSELLPEAAFAARVG